LADAIEKASVDMRESKIREIDLDAGA
ncbi:MAG: hypothetical protein QG610_571, partial [Euryarchaeota archaeon]|nr:hypothetical protein [Euryarchaeota archaeon]